MDSKTGRIDLYLPVRINGDLALFEAILFLLNEKESLKPGSQFDWDFIKSKTKGVDDLLENIRQQDFNFLVKESGVEESLIRKAASLIGSKKKIIICWAMGLTQHKNAVANIQELVNLLLLKGSIGKKGAGTCPVRGHSNVQGDRTMGIWEKPPSFLLNNLKKVFDFNPPTEHGYDVVNAIKAMHQKKAKVLIGMGGNFISATPDTEFTADALRNCSLTVHVSTKLNRSHLIHGEKALILPVLGRAELDLQKYGYLFVTVENSMGVVHSSKGNMPPISNNVISEPELICRLSAELFPSDSISWLDFKDDYSLIREKIQEVIPGFDAFNERVKKPEGFYLPNNARVADFSSTSTGSANFTIHTVKPLDIKTNELLMMTIRTHDQYNTTIYGLNDRYRGVYNERRVILMNEKDMLSNGVENLDVVDITSHFKNKQRTVEKFLVVKYPIPEKCCATYFPETNALVPIGSVAEKSNTPTSKFVVVTIAKP